MSHRVHKGKSYNVTSYRLGYSLYWGNMQIRSQQHRGDLKLLDMHWVCITVEGRHPTVVLL